MSVATFEFGALRSSPASDKTNFFGSRRCPALPTNSAVAVKDLASIFK